MVRRRTIPSHCPQPPVEQDLDLSLLVERHHAECFVAEGEVPGTEIHEDPDVTWLVHPGEAWRNAGIMLRLLEATANRRLSTLIARYQKHGRGMALWISPAATPANLSALLTARGLRCRKHFPAMVRHLSSRRPSRALPDGVSIRVVEDVKEFKQMPHPAIGPLTTPLRRAALRRLAALTSDRRHRTVAYVAWLGGTPVGSSELFLGTDCAGLHSLTVPDEYRGRGIGTALVEHTCREAARRGASKVALLASSDGQPLYERCGFFEVARFGYWYRSFQRR
jgi:GNAT superfamily N-acetyltransferase